MHVGKFASFRMQRNGKRVRKRVFLILKCDDCGELFKRHISHARSDLHFCDRACRSSAAKSGSVLRRRINQTIEIRDPGRKKAKKKFEKTSMQKYGVRHPSNCKEVRDRISKSTKKAMQEGAKQRSIEGTQKRFGIQYTSCFQVPAIREKIRQTVQERYGVDYPFQSPAIYAKIDKKASQSKRIQTCIERYGVPFPMQCDEIKKKFIQTCLDRYGVAHPHQLPETIEKIRQTCIERYGVDSVFRLSEVILAAQQPAVKRKAFMTLKRNGMNYVSKVEIDFFDSIERALGSGSVIRQVFVHKWRIDGYVPIYDTYVQVDGVYWHGIGKTLQELAESIVPRDKAIMKKKLSDIQQNEWFVEHGKKLIRITDLEFKSNDFDVQNFIRRMKVS